MQQVYEHLSGFSFGVDHEILPLLEPEIEIWWNRRFELSFDEMLEGIASEVNIERREIGRCTGLCRYADDRDCNFEGDVIAIYEYVDIDWWLGRSLRTRSEGYFPRSYVRLHPCSREPDSDSDSDVGEDEGSDADEEGIP